MKSCERFELLASLVVDGEATPEEQAELAAHLETCPACRAYSEDIRRIHEACLREPAAVPEGFSAGVMERVRAMEQDRPEDEQKVIPFRHWRRWAALAACCAVAVLSMWTLRGTGGVKGGAVTADDAALASMQMDARAGADEADHDGPAPLFEESEADLGGADTADDEAALADEAKSIPEAYREMAKSAVKDGAGEGQYQPVVSGAQEFSQEPAAAPPAYARNSGETDAPAEVEQTEAVAGMEDVPAPEDRNGLEDKMQEMETGAPAPAEDTVEPAEVVGVPEEGIVIADGSAARAWLETILGMEWTEAGSYPLTAEQYGDLLRNLAEAGEPYQVEPGEGYCLMTK